MNQDCILVVDSDVMVRTPMAAYLRECGYRVLEAATDEEARQLLLDGSIPIDIVFVDVDVPEGKGFALARWIRDYLPSMEVVLAGSPTNAAKKAEDLCEDGPDMAKPYDHQLLLDRIRRLRAARKPT